MPRDRTKHTWTPLMSGGLNPYPAAHGLELDKPKEDSTPEGTDQVYSRWSSLKKLVDVHEDPARISIGNVKLVEVPLASKPIKTPVIYAPAIKRDTRANFLKELDKQRYLEQKRAQLQADLPSVEVRKVKRSEDDGNMKELISNKSDTKKSNDQKTSTQHDTVEEKQTPNEPDKKVKEAQKITTQLETPHGHTSPVRQHNLTTKDQVTHDKAKKLHLDRDNLTTKDFINILEDGLHKRIQASTQRGKHREQILVDFIENLERDIREWWEGHEQDLASRRVPRYEHSRDRRRSH